VLICCYFKDEKGEKTLIFQCFQRLLLSNSNLLNQVKEVTIVVKRIALDYLNTSCYLTAQAMKRNLLWLGYVGVVAFMFTSCTKNSFTWTPEEIVVEEAYIPDSLKLNFIWVKPSPDWGTMFGARYEIRNSEDSLLCGGVDVMGPNDSVFQFYPHYELKSEAYKFLVKSPTGQLLSEREISFDQSQFTDEWMLSDTLFTYYFQMTWKPKD
jgi:hypothetical protein